MTAGLVVAVSPRSVGDTLAADVAAGAIVLPVWEAGAFDEEFDEPRYLVLGDDLTPLQYVAVENDEDSQQSVTLAAGVPFAAEAGLPVTLWDPSVEVDDKRAVEFVAQVRLDDQDDATIPARIPHELVPLAGVYSLEGAQVGLVEDDEGWLVGHVLGRSPVVDPGYLDRPLLTSIIVEDAPAGPVAPPAESPTIDATGLADTFVITSTPLASTDQVALHMSAVSGFVPDETTLLPGTPTASTVVPVTALPSGAQLEQDVIYFFRPVAVNAVGVAAAGVEVSASLDPTKVDSLVLATLRAGGVEFGKMKVGAGSWDPDVGITIPQSNGQETLISSNPNIASRWAGQVIGTFVTIMQGIVTGLLEVLGTARLSKGVSAPRSAPGVTEAWARKTTLATPNIANTRHGLATGIDPTTWVTLNYDSQKIEIYSKATGALVRSLSVALTGASATACWLTLAGNYYWVINRDKFGNYYRSALDSAGVEASARVSLDITESDVAKGFPVIDAGPSGEFDVAWPKAGTTKVAIRRFSHTGLTVSPISSFDVEMGFTKALGSVALGAFDYGVGNRLLVFPLADNPKGFQTSGVRDSTLDFPAAYGDRVNGVAWDEGQFHSLNDTNLVRLYSSNKVTRDLGFAHAWASEDGTRVTQAPMVTRLIQRARAQVHVTTEPPPEAGQSGATKANRVAIYVGENVYYRQTIRPVGLNLTPLGVTADSNGPERSPSNGFASIASTGRLTSEATTVGTQPAIDLRGDGLWWLGPLRGDATKRLDPHPRGGRATIPFSGTNPTTGSLRVEFGFTYPSTPAVTATVVGANPDNTRITVSDIDTTGATLYITRVNGGFASSDCSWIVVPQL